MVVGGTTVQDKVVTEEFESGGEVEELVDLLEHWALQKLLQHLDIPFFLYFPQVNEVVDLLFFEAEFLSCFSHSSASLLA